MNRRGALHSTVMGTLLLVASTAAGTDVTGTVQLQGMVGFAAPIPGIALTDLSVGAREESEATGNGEQCEITAVSSANADVSGLYGGI